MKSYQVIAIVLKRSNVREADKIITVLSQEKGKIRLIAKGIRKISSKKAPHLEPFSMLKMQVAEGKNLDIITETNPLNFFTGIRTDLKKVATAYQMCELIDKLCPEEQRNRSLFELLKTELEFLNNSGEWEGLSSFANKVLWDLGFLPRDQRLDSQNLQNYLNQVMEKKLKSTALLTTIENLL